MKSYLMYLLSGVGILLAVIAFTEDFDFWGKVVCYTPLTVWLMALNGEVFKKERRK